ncbi:UvrD-helicase domain-containing protein [Flagellimonas allohymeniacidonis]|uniref:DNA 3'-5' helicase n=1 Tax=Flagellimonas allohymeniacidonis TaxID=2517819 RepID=A0A4Q8QET6_9FLAO|nr:UvrD-helicase domain-containing protein [Allomuricauda hymeniacidonis]TAI47698.1 ATP-dependent helicase [Allomuricauda hymeniacidonis]
MDSVFTIYSASAGSGKTYTLTKNYLRLLFKGDALGRFRQILALTFTNKAVGEMKSRILDSLHHFSKKDILDSSNSLFQELCEETGLSPNELHNRSKVLLKHLLHNYSFFDVSTIDKFNHRILKTFARDLQLSQNFEVELDTDSLLEKAVDRLLDRAGSDKALTKTLLAFSYEKVDDNKSWNIAYDLVEMGKLLFQENHSVHLEKLKNKSIADFDLLKNSLLDQIQQQAQQTKEKAESVLAKILDDGFQFEEFPRQTLPNHFKKIRDGEQSVKSLYNNQLEKNLLDGNILKASDTRDTALLSEYLLQEYRAIKKSLYQRAYLRNIYGNVVPMTLLNEISKELKEIENEQDLIPISALNELISKEIKGQPVPFIYERLGEKYRHYFIDEFQDTSQLQWENLIPLISNALESENEQSGRGSLFLVGDVKQAIYRWRGGRAEQFLNLLGLKTNPFNIQPNIKTLDTNWRSASEIIAFNNAFFSSVAPVLGDEVYRNLFLQDSQQKFNPNLGGYVQLSFIEKTTTPGDDEFCIEVLRTIQEVLSKNYQFSDMCILVRENKKGGILADYLSRNKIPVISPDSLLLANNPTIHFLAALLRLLNNTDDKTAAFEVLSFLADENPQLHDFVSIHLEKLPAFLLERFELDLESLKRISVYQILENAIDTFQLAQGAEAYLTFFMDFVLEIEKKEGPGILAFLEYWEDKKGSLSLAAPEGENAIKIMTIHKAKGLEFPFVIFPYANAALDDKRKKKKSWVVSDDHISSWSEGEFLLNTSQEMLSYNTNSELAYLEEQNKTQMDALNVLYVALTRAELGLFVITEWNPPISDIQKATTYSDLFLYHLNSEGVLTETQRQYSFGKLLHSANPKEEISEDNHISYITRSMGETGHKISTTSGQLWGTDAEKAIEIGNLVHFALGKIIYLEDEPSVLDELKSTGQIQGEEGKMISNLVHNTVHHPLLKEYFTSSYTIYNEREILTQGGSPLRPDRIAIQKNEATLIDFKTGKVDPKHKAQLERYGDAIKSMGFSIKNSIIVYIDKEVNPLFLNT